MFFIFIKACKKYKFDFTLSTYGKTSMMIRPKNTIENIDISQGYYHGYESNKLFLMAIKEMKRYRKERGYQ